MTATPDSQDTGRRFAFISLFTSTGTLVCCALPALLVAVGAGAALSTLISVVPGLVWVSEYKEWVFVLAGVMLAVSGWLQYKSRFAPCPVDPAQRDACLRTRKTSARIYLASVTIYVVGGFFAFVLPLLI
ncbi:MAG: hypothetical protein WBK51_05015 [Polaromonas sp.]